MAPAALLRQMQLKPRRLIIGIGMTLIALATATAQPTAQTVPPFSEVEAVWTAFWNHISLGDLEAALKYVYSGRRHLYPSRVGPEEVRRMQAAAHEMAFCRIDPAPVFIANDEVFYRLHCRHGDETAEGQIGLRLDFDGVWRLSAM